MKANLSEAKKRDEKQVYCPNLDQNEPSVRAVVPFPESTEQQERGPKTHPKTSADYWRDKVAPRPGAKNGLLQFRLTHAGRTAWVNLKTSNKAEAARTARDLWVTCQSKGLTATLAAFSPKDPAKAPEIATVGEYIEAAAKLATVRATTLRSYESAFFRLAGAVRGIASKSDKQADRIAWRQKVSRLRLDQIPPASVRSFFAAELAEAAKAGENAKDRRAHTIASDLRDARALFSKVILRDLPKTIVLPPELPFSGIPAGATTRRFVSTVDPRKLYAAAKALKTDTRCAFDLLLVAGLRRGEADSLTWKSINLDAGTLTVETTEFFRPKSRESHRVVPLPADFVTRLRARKGSAPDSACVLDGLPLAPLGKIYRYRASGWGPLTEWLKSQGIADRTPLHTLRKMSGSFVYQVGGLEAARRHLGHRDISTTAASYLAGGAVTVNLGKP